MSDIPPNTCMTTCTCNATAHPGLVDSSLKRTHGKKMKKEMAEEWKKEKVQKKQDAICKIGNVEKRMTDNEMVNVTPGPQAAKGQTCQLQCTKSYVQLPLTEETLSSDDTELIDDTTHTAPIDTDISENELPAKKIKPVKVSLHDLVNLYIEKERGKMVNDERKHENVGTKEGDTSRVHANVKGDLDDDDDEMLKKAAKKLCVISEDDEEVVVPAPKDKEVGSKGKVKLVDQFGQVECVDQNVSDRKAIRSDKPNKDVTTSKDRHTALIRDWAKKVPPTAKPALDRVLIHQHNDDVIKIADSEGPLSDHDETKGPEHEAAIKSPPKGKKCVTSSAIIKLEDSPKPVLKASRSCTGKKPMNDGLPKEWLEDSAWCKKVIPTLLRWASIQPNPWIIPDAKITNALEKICVAFYGDSEYLDHGIATTSTTFRLASQQLSDSWCSVFGSCAIVILNAFFEAHDEYHDSDEMRRDFARHSLKMLRFIYHKAKGDDKRKFKGPFRGSLIIHTFAAHFNTIKGSSWIHGLFEGEMAPKPCPALALSTAVAERALTLYTHGAITIEKVHEAKMSKKSLKLPVTINLGTSKESAQNVAFGYVGWSDQTTKYLVLITKSISNIDMDNIMTEAKEFSRASAHELDQSGARDSIDVDDKCANITKGSRTSDEESDEDDGVGYGVGGSKDSA